MYVYIGIENVNIWRRTLLRLQYPSTRRADCIHPFIIQYCAQESASTKELPSIPHRKAHLPTNNPVFPPGKRNNLESTWIAHREAHLLMNNPVFRTEKFIYPWIIPQYAQGSAFPHELPGIANRGARLLTNNPVFRKGKCIYPLIIQHCAQESALYTHYPVLRTRKRIYQRTTQYFPQKSAFTHDKSSIPPRKAH